jgi:transcriptional regulator with XRE-family HTH domain
LIMSDFTNINDWYGMSDNAILKQLAGFVKQVRLRKNYKQSELAERSGIHRVTLSEFEKGDRSISLLTFIELLRALNELELLDAFKTQAIISPLQIAKLEAKKRQRASGKHQGAVNKKVSSKKKKK